MDSTIVGVVCFLKKERVRGEMESGHVTSVVINQEFAQLMKIRIKSESDDNLTNKKLD